jgi:hypothetical protein
MARAYFRDHLLELCAGLKTYLTLSPWSVACLSLTLVLDSAGFFVRDSWGLSVFSVQFDAFLAAEAGAAGIWSLEFWRWRAWLPRLVASRAVTYWLYASLDVFTEEYGWLGYLLLPLILSWYALEPRATLRRRGSRSAGITERLSFILDRYPFFMGYGLLPAMAYCFSESAIVTALFVAQLAATLGTTQLPNPRRTFYTDPVELLDDVCDGL